MPRITKNAVIGLRISSVKKRYLDDHYGKMLPLLINAYLDKLVSCAAMGITPRDAEKFRDAMKD